LGQVEKTVEKTERKIERYWGGIKKIAGDEILN
jgi:hypothetical protein